MNSTRPASSIPSAHFDSNFTAFTPPSPCAESVASAAAVDEMRNQRQLTLTFNFWTLGVLIPVIAVLGILANTASIVVLTRRTMRSSPINVYLAGLSAFDGLLLLMTLLLYPALSYCELEDSITSPWCQYFFHSALFTYPLSLVMHNGSVWTLTAITIDRFIAITWPLQCRDWCTSRRANWVVGVIALWSLLYNLPSFFELRLVMHLPSDSSLEDHFSNGTLNSTEISLTTPPAGQVVLMQTDLRRHPNYVVAYKGYCYLIFMLLLPAGMMIILNVFVTVSVRRAYRLRKAMSGREDKERRCTMMAVLVVVTFLVLNSLAFINNLIEIFATTSPTPPLDDPENVSTISSNDTECEQQQAPGTKSNAYLLLVSVGNVLVALNSATNFLIYCALGLRFRKMFCKIFCPRRCGASWLAADIMANEKSYQSLAVRYSVYGTAAEIRKRVEITDAPSRSVSVSPVRRGSQLLVDGAFGSVCISPSDLQISASYSSHCKLKKDLGNFV